jgi:hypothetical protein
MQAIGILQVICEVIKSGSAEQIQSQLASLLSISRVIQGSPLLNNTVVRKYKTKLVSRLALRLLPTGSGTSRRQGLYPDPFADTQTYKIE